MKFVVSSNDNHEKNSQFCDTYATPTVIMTYDKLNEHFLISCIPGPRTTLPSAWPLTFQNFLGKQSLCQLSNTLSRYSAAALLLYLSSSDIDLE